MPQPIIPIHKQENLNITFGDSDLPGFNMSEAQMILLQPSVIDRGVKKIASNVIMALENIDKSTDLIVTAVSEGNERICSVPRHIDDHILLSLKASGLVTGHGRSVKITAQGKEILRDHYLKSSNLLRENRKSEKFDFGTAVRVAFKKVK